MLLKINATGNKIAKYQPNSRFLMISTAQMHTRNSFFFKFGCDHCSCSKFSFNLTRRKEVFRGKNAGTNFCEELAPICFLIHQLLCFKISSVIQCWMIFVILADFSVLTLLAVPQFFSILRIVSRLIFYRNNEMAFLEELLKHWDIF